MKIRTFASIAVMSTLGLLTPIHAYAFGLGKLELSSNLNEPFKAEILVTALKDEDVGNFQVRLASNEEFERAGLVRNALLISLKIEVVEKAGKTKIVLSSEKAIKEPMLDFLLTATTDKGRLIREYVALLDPPKNMFVKPREFAPVVAPTVTPTPAPKFVESKPVATLQPKTTTYQYPTTSVSSGTSTSTSHQYSSPNNLSSATSYGPTERYDTLWSIALKTRPDYSISQRQRMMALLKENPEAFNGNNVNALKTGYTLSIPTLDQIESMSKSAALNAVKKQNGEWKQQRNALFVNAVSQAGGSDALATNSSTTGTASDNTARLQLLALSDETSPADSELSPLGSAQLQNINEQSTLAQETIESQTQENIDINARMGIMEEQIQTLHRIISIKDADLARLQSTLEDEGLAAEDLSEIEMPVVPLSNGSEQQLAETDEGLQQEINTDEPEAIDELETQTEEATDTEQQWPVWSEAPSLDEMEVAEGDAIFDASASDADSSSSGVTEKITAVFDKIKSLFSEYKMIVISVAALLFFALIALFARGRKKKTAVDDYLAQKDSDVEEIVVGSAAIDEDLNDNVEESLADTVDTESVLQQEFVEEQEEQTEPDDTLILATELTETQDVVPSDLDFNLDDLTTDNRQDDDSTSSEVADLDKKDDDMLDFNVDNAAFDALDKDDESLTLDIAEDATEENIAEEPLAFDVNEDALTEDESTLDIAKDTTEENIAGEALAFNLDEETAGEDSLISNIDKPEVPTSLDDITPEESAETPEVTVDEAREELTAQLDDDLLQEPTGADVKFDLGYFDEIDEAETKLDLASAYAEMGDGEGAKSMLQEVVAEGNDEQKTRAQSKLNELS